MHQNHTGTHEQHCNNFHKCSCRLGQKCLPEAKLALLPLPVRVSASHPRSADAGLGAPHSSSAHQ